MVRDTKKLKNPKTSTHKGGKFILYKVYYRPFLKFLLSCFLVAGVLVLISALVPDSKNATKHKEGLLLFLRQYYWLIGGIIFSSLIFRNTRDTLKSLTLESKKTVITRRICLCLMTSLLLFAFVYVQPAGRFNAITILALAYVMLALTLFWIWIRFTRKSPKDLKNTILPEDNPISSLEDLSDHQKTVADDLSRIIAQEPLTRSIGLYGDWGTGKTSIYRACRKIVSGTNSDILWLDFKPWKYASQEALIAGFYSEIGQLIEDEVGGWQGMIRKLTVATQPLVKGVDKTGTLEFVRNLFSQKLGDSAANNLIINMLRDSGRRLVISIDDVERVADATQLFRTLQMVHELHDQRVMYVFIADKTALLKHLNDLVGDRADEYLEKFIEYELHVPTPTLADLKLHLSNQTTSEGLKELPARILEDIGSHRAMLKVTGKFVNDANGRLGSSKIDSDDRFIMDFLLIKYYTIWQDINRHRRRYVGGYADEIDYFRRVDEDEDNKKRRQSIELLISGYPEEKKEFLVEDVLSPIFPVVANAFGRPSSNLADRVLLAQQRVAHHDVLDDYFSLSMQHDVYLAQRSKVNEALRHAVSEDIVATKKDFQDIFQDVNPAEPGSSDVILILSDLICEKFESMKRIKVLRIWLASYLEWARVFPEHRDYTLHRILTAIEITVSNTSDKERERYLDHVFKSITSHIASPSISLRLFSAIVYEDSFVKLRSYSKINRTYHELLLSVDSYYLDSNKNFFKHREMLDAIYEVHMWAGSGTSLWGNQSTEINSSIKGAKTRCKRVNRYIFDILSTDDALAYRFVKALFWHSDDEGWREVGYRGVFDYAKICELANSLSKSTTLLTPERKQIQELSDLLDAFKRQQKKAAKEKAYTQ